MRRRDAANSFGFLGLTAFLCGAATLCAVFAPVSALGQTAPLATTGFIRDAENGCGTSNPIPRPGESIRWRGGCRDGLLDGPGALMWLQDGKVREQNEGTFVAGEVDGQATTSFPDGSMVVGTYARGVRHGEFLIRRANGDAIRAIFADGQLLSERQLNAAELRALRDRSTVEMPVAPAPAARATAPTMQAPVAAGPPPPAVVAPAAPVTAAPAAAPVMPAPAQPARAVAAVSAAPSPPPGSPRGGAAASPWSPSANLAALRAASAPGGTTAAAAGAPWSPTSNLSALGLPTAPVAATPVVPAAYVPAAAMPAAAPLPLPRPATGYAAAPQPAYLPASQAPAYQPAPQIAYAAAAPQTVAATVPVSTPASASQRVMDQGGVDQAIGDAMLLERAGRNGEALALYSEVAMAAAGTPTGQLAAERAARLAAPGDRPVAYAGAPLPLPGPTPLEQADRRQMLAGRLVCSARDIFPSSANWCGRVLREEGNDVEVELRSLRTNRLFAVGFAAAPCTGGKFLGPFAEGERIWVSRGCLEGNL
jgi:hypothetical protein